MSGQADGVTGFGGAVDGQNQDQCDDGEEEGEGASHAARREYHDGAAIGCRSMTRMRWVIRVTSIG